jgi:hypothetical protein
VQLRISRDRLEDQILCLALIDGGAIHLTQLPHYFCTLPHLPLLCRPLHVPLMHINTYTLLLSTIHSSPCLILLLLSS